MKSDVGHLDRRVVEGNEPENGATEGRWNLVVVVEERVVQERGHEFHPATNPPAKDEQK